MEGKIEKLEAENAKMRAVVDAAREILGCPFSIDYASNPSVLEFSIAKLRIDKLRKALDRLEDEG